MSKMLNHKIIGFVLITIAVYVSYNMHRNPHVGIDDANIFLNYAENLSSGKGITYSNNLDPVEGYTSTLWMFTMTLILMFGGGEFSILLLSVILLYLTYLFTCKIVDQKRNNNEIAIHVVILILFVSDPSFITWNSITLMDTILYVSFIVISIYLVLEKDDTFNNRFTLL